MSQIAPAIPELEPVPEPIRGLVWMRAMMQGTRSAETWLIFVGAQVVLIGAGAVAGLQVFSLAGAALGGLIGAGLALYLLFKAIVPWQARRFLRTAGREIDWRAEFRAVLDGQDRIDRVIAASRRHEGR